MKYQGKKDLLLKKGMPFVKVELLRDNPIGIRLGPVYKALSKTNYDLNLISFDRPIKHVSLKKLLFRGVHRGELKETVINNQPMLLMSPVIYSLVWNKLFGVKEEIDLRKVSMDHLNIILEGLRVDGPNNPGKTIRSDEKK